MAGNARSAGRDGIYIRSSVKDQHLFYDGVSEDGTRTCVGQPGPQQFTVGACAPADPSLGYDVLIEPQGRATVTVAWADISGPVVNFRRPEVAGTTIHGRTVRARAGDWSVPLFRDLSYRWFLDGRAVRGATKDKFTLPASSAGKRVSVEVTATYNRTEEQHAPGVAVSRALIVR